MRATIILIAFLSLLPSAHAQYGYGMGSNPNSNNVQGYYNRNGNYVNSYQRTNPDSNRYNNYGSPGNYNPNTGRYSR